MCGPCGVGTVRNIIRTIRIYLRNEWDSVITSYCCYLFTFFTLRFCLIFCYLEFVHFLWHVTWVCVFVSVLIWIQTAEQDGSVGTKSFIDMKSSTLCLFKNTLPAVCSSIASCHHENSTETLCAVLTCDKLLNTEQYGQRPLWSYHYCCFSLMPGD